MKFLLLLLPLIGCVSSQTSSFKVKGESNPWQLVWHDEFNGSTLDLSKWSHEENCWGGGNNELQCYTSRPKNSFVSNGHLYIVAYKEQYTGRAGQNGDGEPKTLPYTSARLRTKHKAEFKYGRICMRAKLPYGQGTWPAFWMLPTDSPYGGWSASGEIDIVETVNISSDPNADQDVHGTLWYGGQYPNQVSSSGHHSVSNPAFNFHEYCIEWDKNSFKWFVDNEFYQSKVDWWSEKGEGKAPFDTPFHILLNLAIGGDWPKSPDDSTIFPQEFVIDYVRVFTHKCRRSQ